VRWARFSQQEKVTRSKVAPTFGSPKKFSPIINSNFCPIFSPINQAPLIKIRRSKLFPIPTIIMARVNYKKNRHLKKKGKFALPSKFC
jgi:hypothetical protein